MTTTVNISWAQPDERDDGREDSCWYTYASMSDLVAHVTNGERTIGIYADGEMRIGVYSKVEDEFVYHGLVRYCDELETYGVDTDNDLWGLPSVSGMFDLCGPNTNGFYYRIDNNSWFDLYEDSTGTHLDCVCDTLSRAIEMATVIINDDSDEIWKADD